VWQAAGKRPRPARRQEGGVLRPILEDKEFVKQVLGE